MTENTPGFSNRENDLHELKVDVKELKEYKSKLIGGLAVLSLVLGFAITQIVGRMEEKVKEAEAIANRAHSAAIKADSIAHRFDLKELLAAKKELESTKLQYENTKQQYNVLVRELDVSKREYGMMLKTVSKTNGEQKTLIEQIDTEPILKIISPTGAGWITSKNGLAGEIILGTNGKEVAVNGEKWLQYKFKLAFDHNSSLKVAFTQMR